MISGSDPSVSFGPNDLWESGSVGVPLARLLDRDFSETRRAEVRIFRRIGGARTTKCLRQGIAPPTRASRQQSSGGGSSDYGDALRGSTEPARSGRRYRNQDRGNRARNGLPTVQRRLLSDNAGRAG